MLLQIPSQKTIDLQLPAFFKDEIGESTVWVGILNDDTFVKMWDIRDSTQVGVFNPKDPYKIKEIVEAVSTFQPTTEAEFFTAFARLHNDINILPVLREGKNHG